MHPGDLKTGLEGFLNKLLDPIRMKFENPQLMKLIEEAYPIALQPSKKGKQAKNKDKAVVYVLSDIYIIECDFKQNYSMKLKDVP